MADVMEKFFEPKSVCVIGASSTPGKPGNVVVKNMRDAGYKGDVYLVNPRGGEIEGYKVYKSIGDLPDNIDQAVVTLPASLAPETVRALGAKGTKAIVLGGQWVFRSRSRRRGVAGRAHCGHSGIRGAGPGPQYDRSRVGAVVLHFQLFPTR